MDGRKVELPELEGIVILNINSWCGGCELWASDDEEHSVPPRSVYSHVLDCDHSLIILSLVFISVNF